MTAPMTGYGYGYRCQLCGQWVTPNSYHGCMQQPYPNVPTTTPIGQNPLQGVVEAQLTVIHSLRIEVERLNAEIARLTAPTITFTGPGDKK